MVPLRSAFAKLKLSLFFVLFFSFFCLTKITQANSHLFHFVFIQTVIADHTGDAVASSTLNAVTAAKSIGGDITVLVAGSSCEGAANSAAAIDGVTAVLHADDESLGHQVAENVTNVILAAQEAGSYTHILQAATNDGKNTLPRVAAALDVSPILDILTVESEDTFTRPMYAGNAIATVQSGDAVKVSLEYF